MYVASEGTLSKLECFDIQKLESLRFQSNLEGRMTVHCWSSGYFSQNSECYIKHNSRCNKNVPWTVVVAQLTESDTRRPRFESSK